MDYTTELKLEPPKKLYQRKIKVETEKLFTALFKSLFDISLLQWESASKELISVISALGIKSNEGEKVYVLILFSFIKASWEVLKKNHELFHRGFSAKPFEGYFDFCDEILKKSNSSISFDFFENPSSISVLQKFVHGFEAWFSDKLGLEKEQVQSLSYLLSEQFHHEITKEWKSRKSYYNDVYKYFDDSPFDQGLKNTISKGREKKNYNELLAQEFLGTFIAGQDKIRLSDIYFDPNFSIFYKCFSEKDDRLKAHRNTYTNDSFVSIDQRYTLQKLAIDFLNRKNKFQLYFEDPQLLLIHGYPGQGKTSFCKKLQHTLVKKVSLRKRNVFSVRLREIKNGEAFLRNPLEEIKKYIEWQFRRYQIKWSLSEEDFYSSVLILDGLDELHLLEGFKSQNISLFFSELSRQLSFEPGLQIVLTSRFGFFDLNSIFKKSGPDISESSISSRIIVARIDNFSVEKQISWLRKFRKFSKSCALTEEDVKKINLNPELHYLKELIGQPIILNLIALVGLKKDGYHNRSTIYDHLFSSLIDRSWTKESQISPLQGLKKENLRSFLQDIALAIHHSGYNHITKEELLGLTSTRKFTEELLRVDQENPLTNILISFYFNTYDEPEEITSEPTQFFELNSRKIVVEFMHKSLQEYLVAEKVWKTILMLLKRENNIFIINNSSAASELLFPVLAPQILSLEIIEYIKLIILNHDIGQNRELFSRMVLFLTELVENSFYNDSIPYKNPTRECANSFYGYWVVFSFLRENKNYISANIIASFCYLIKVISINDGIKLDLSFQDLDGGDLSGANLSMANLKSISLKNSNLERTNLNGAELIDADLSNSNLRNAILENVTYDGLNIVGASVDVFFKNKVLKSQLI